MRPRAWAALLLLACLLVHTDVAAEPVSIAYRAMAGARQIGEGTLKLDLDGNRYKAAVDGLLATPLMAGAQNRTHAEVAGRIVRRALVPERYRAEVARPGADARVALGFADGTVGSISTEPRMRPDPRRIPLSERHKHGVVDPLSALIVPAAGPGYAPLSACSRTQAVFDGWSRYNIVLFPSQVETVLLNETPVTTYVCRLRSQPVAGHLRRARGSARGLVWLSPVGDGRLLAPVRLEADFGFGRLVILAKEAGPFGAAQLEADARPHGREVGHSASTFSASHTLISD